jgi:hypothetical protein
MCFISISQNAAIVLYVTKSRFIIVTTIKASSKRRNNTQDFIGCNENSQQVSSQYIHTVIFTTRSVRMIYPQYTKFLFQHDCHFPVATLLSNNIQEGDEFPTGK